MNTFVFKYTDSQDNFFFMDFILRPLVGNKYYITFADGQKIFLNPEEDDLQEVKRTIINWIF